jgi:anti-sigma factor RsiW
MTASSGTCATPIAFEQLVDYWTSELDAAAIDAIEDHVFACARCAAEMERVHGLVGVFREHLPPLISNEQLEELRAKGHVIVETTFEPGVRRGVTFEREYDFMIHHLAGLSLGGATRVSVTVRIESTGDVVHVEPFAPFDRERGEVLIACQKHFAMFPPDVVFDVRVHAASGSMPKVSTYSIPHVFVQ